MAFLFLISGVQLTTVLLAIIVVLCSYFMLKHHAEYKRYPPGPYPLPLIGNLIGMAKYGMSEYLHSNRKIYGDVFTIEFGGFKRVVVCGADNIQNVLVRNADYSSNRNTQAFGRTNKKKNGGIIWGEFPSWKLHRSFALTVLREGGMGKSLLEPRINDEAQHYCEYYIEPFLGKPVDLARSLNYATSNVIMQLVNGTRYDYHDDIFQFLHTNLEEGMKRAQVRTLLQNLPFAKLLQKFDPETPPILEYMMSIIQNTRSALKSGQQGMSYIERAINHADRVKGNDYFNDKEIGTACYQLFGGGTETTATMLKWCLIYMIHYPEVQTKIQLEIDEVLGERSVSMKDKKNMPYTDSVLLELLRVSFMSAPLPHTLDSQLSVCGKVIPAGSELFINYAADNKDETYFPNSTQFQPERFMGVQGQELRSKFLPFGAGRRVCIGESLARMEMFMFFVTFLQKYNMNAPLDGLPSLDGTKTLIRSPFPYKLIFSKR